MGIGIKKMTSGKKAFINFPQDLIAQEYATLLPKQWVVVELLENVEPDQEIISACRKLKKLGYTLALDDFEYDQKFEPLIELADIIKVDFTLTKGEERETVVQKFKPRGILLLAEKVKTREEFNQSMEAGYSYFQGYFFDKPEILSTRKIPGFKLNYLRILQEINQPELDFRRLEEIIKQEVSLSYQLLKYINSALFGLRRRVESIRQTLALLGDNNVKKWVSLVALCNIGEDKPMELVVTSIIRANFCESLANKVGLRNRANDLFLLGLFSMIDALIDQPMSDILAELSISEDIKTALLGGNNLFRSVYESVLAYEKGNWEQFSALASKLRLCEDEVPDFYQKSVELANGIFSIR